MPGEYVTVTDPISQGQSIALAFERHHQALTRLATRYLHCSDDAQDAVQRVFEKLIIAGHGSVPARNVIGYLVLAVRREAIRMITKHRRSVATEPGRLAVFSDVRQAMGLRSEEDSLVELRNEIERCRSLLSPAQAHTLFSALDGFSLVEIAVESGVSYETAKTHFKRAVTKIRHERARASARA